MAQQAWDEGNVEQAMELLNAQQPLPGQEDLRGFEWRYLWRLSTQPDALFTFRSVACSPDNKTLVSLGADGAIKLWGAAGRDTDGRTLASTGMDKTVRLWRAPSLAKADAQIGSPPRR